MDAQGRVPGHEELLFTEGMMSAMADSSKRLRSENEDAGFEGYEWVGTPQAKQFHLDGPTGSQAPVPPNSKTGLKLPPRVTDLKDWGTTTCKLPKVASLKLPYDDMVMDSKNHGSCLDWVLAHGANRGGHLEGLHVHLMAIDCDHWPLLRRRPGYETMPQSSRQS